MPRFLLLLAVSLCPLAAIAAEPVAELTQLLSSAKSVEAKFEQTVTGANGVVSQRATGTMDVARPQLFRWDVKTPFEQLIVADGKQVWVYDPDLQQAVVRPFDKQLADTPALLFSGDAKKIGERYDVSLLAGAGAEKADGEAAATQRFELKPRDKEALFESLRVSFRDGHLSGMMLVDSLGQKTAIAFSDVVLNGNIPPARFHFTPPHGTDVIRAAK